MKNYWIILALIACFITSCEIVINKFIANNCIKKNIIIVIALCFVLTGIIASIYLMFNISKVKNLKLNKNIIKSILILSILIIISKIVIINSLAITPNIGYTHMIINFNVIITFIIGYLLFKQKINKYGLFGIILCLIGLFIIIKTC